MTSRGYVTGLVSDPFASKIVVYSFLSLSCDVGFNLIRIGLSSVSLKPLIELPLNRA